MKKPRKLAIWLGLCASLVAVTAPAHAAGVGVGELAVSGEATLAEFPCPIPGPGELPCEGSFEGVAAGTIAGRNIVGPNAHPWTLLLDAPMTMSFSYVDSLPPEPDCVEGLAIGSASINAGGANQAFGSYHNGVVPLAVLGASGSFDFQWRRMGTVVLFSVSNFDLTLNVNALGPVTVIENGTGESAAAFVPTSASAQTIPDCVNGTQGELTAAITGHFHLARMQ